MATVREQIMGVLSDGLAHTRRQIVDAVEAPQNQVDTMLGKLLDKGLLRRLEPGLYRLAQPDDQIPQFVAQPVADASELESDADDETVPPLVFAYWSDGDVVIRRGDEPPFAIFTAQEVRELVAFLARTGHCYTHGELAARED